MRRREGWVLFSPTDLVRFADSAFASWLDRLHVERPGVLEPAEDDAQLELLARRGMEHEARVLARLAEERGEVTKLGETPGTGATSDAVASRDPVIAQARLADAEFAGRADFLVLEEESDRYEIWDAKLARSAKPSHLLQLACYAELFEATTGERVEHVVVALGTGEQARFRMSDVRWYARALRGEFVALMERFDPDADPPEPDPGAEHGRWAAYADRWFDERDHLCRVANIRRSQIERLVKVGIETLAALASTALSTVPGIGSEVFPRLVRQAKLQLLSRGSSSTEYRVLPPPPDLPQSGLARLPPATAGDVYLDLEGFPLADDGLEYLIGAVTVEDGEPRFHDWWAHDEEQERVAFEGLMDFLVGQRDAHPGLHVFHYAPYELTALRRLAGKYGTREDELDTLLRGEVFVDLLSIVRQGLAVGEPSYSLKYVERLYRGAREGDVVDAAASIVEYDRWIESGEPQDWASSPILAAIRDYNRDDCESTWGLARWLWERQAEAGVPYAGPIATDPQPERALSPQNELRRQTSFDMLEEAAALDDSTEEAREHRRVHTLLAHLLEFHRREDKPLWWALFDRAEKTHEDLVEDAECLGDAHDPGAPVPVKQSYRVSYAFDPDQETKLDVRGTVHLAHNVEVSATVELLDRDIGRLELRFGPKAWTQLGGRPPDRVSLVPFELIRTNTIRAAIADVVSAWRARQELPRALADFLFRRAPRIVGHEGGALLEPDEDLVAGAVRVVDALDRSCLVIQGPPGAGKTHTAAHAIVALLDKGRNVGITSNSHRAIENLMRACSEAAGGRLSMLKVGKASKDFRKACPNARVCVNAEADAEFDGGLVGGTAWLFSRPEWAGRLDALIVDEAGQVSVANLVGMSRSASNLVLVGDQMQLAQPTQGAHPGESGLSCLDYFLQGQATIPDDLGLFLSRTWRLHPDLCNIVSDAIYEGRLLPEEHTVRRVVRLPEDGGELVRKEAGLVHVPVEHVGNTQASDEEVETVQRVVEELIGRPITDEDGQPAGHLGLDDILFVAPYNRQVRRLREALGPHAHVGSVDKFQGLQKRVVVISMCASPGEYGSRGSAFLLDRNRLNVAISRAQSLAVLLSHPRLGLGSPSTVEELFRLNLMCRLVAEGSPVH